ncbi:hypothetical protein DVH24_019234 [Malus domestica]|uniref:Mitochondrial fission protein ELM1 n=1 Tax=Malus domestica TaxID=3750 RepID=A0A498HY79_MALDO|nr:hypothetical protein DVH24_019234 [Malus domestica]
MAEMIQGGVHRATGIRRAVVIGNGFAGAENQSIGLVRALGLWGRQSLYRVRRPRGGINEWLHWLPLPLHKKVVPLHLSSEKLGLSSDIPEADAKQIAEMARRTFDKDGPLLVVASGRDTIPVSSAIKQLAPENVFLVQTSEPVNLRDVLFLTVGALHQADFAALKSAASVWHAELTPLPKPLLVVNIGGPSSRNPHMGHLACADAFVITADSMSLRWSYTPMDDTAEAARRVNKALAERGWSIQLT